MNLNPASPPQIWKEDPSLRTIEKQEDMLVARVVLSSHNAKDVVGGQEDRALCYRALEALQVRSTTLLAALISPAQQPSHLTHQSKHSSVQSAHTARDHPVPYALCRRPSPYPAPRLAGA